MCDYCLPAELEVSSTTTKYHTAYWTTELALWAASASARTSLVGRKCENYIAH